MHELDGRQLSALWGSPFVGLLLTIAVLPLLAPAFWHRHFGKLAAGWSLAFLLPCALIAGPSTTLGVAVHTLLAEYLPFVVLLTALFTIAGGIHIRGHLHGSPRLNAGLMLVGALLASVMGTTGASMLMIRTLIRANEKRQHKAHVLVFFIFIVSNAGGSLTPLGDPPLFLGFLQGVSFFWTAKHLLPQTWFLIAALLGIFLCVDHWFQRREGALPHHSPHDVPRFGIEGSINFILLALVVALVLMSGLWKPGISFDVVGTELSITAVVRDLGLAMLALVSLWLTPHEVRAKNHFSWAPMQEVAKLFVGIFLTMVPVLAMLKAGEAGALGAVTRAVTGPEGQALPWAYFWLTGLLSAFLDNAPTYLVFFNLAGGDAAHLMGPLAPTLAAISAGAVFMGAMSYIGNAPNFMVKAIAEDRGVRMPGFFGYMLWSVAVLLPLFAIMTFLWFC